MQDYKLNYWIEALQISLEESGVFGILSDEVLRNVAKDMIHASEMQSQAFGWDQIPSPAKAEKSETEKRLENRIKELENEILCYRKSVAQRRGVPLEDVYLDYGGDVIYGKALTR
jgi:hypothetical protein